MITYLSILSALFVVSYRNSAMLGTTPTMQRNAIEVELKKITKSNVKSLQISTSITYNKAVTFHVGPYSCIKLGVDLVKPDWNVSVQATVASWADVKL